MVCFANLLTEVLNWPLSGENSKYVLHLLTVPIQFYIHSQRSGNIKELSLFFLSLHLIFTDSLHEVKLQWQGYSKSPWLVSENLNLFRRFGREIKKDSFFSDVRKEEKSLVEWVLIRFEGNSLITVKYHRYVGLKSLKYWKMRNWLKWAKWRAASKLFGDARANMLNGKAGTTFVHEWELCAALCA